MCATCIGTEALRSPEYGFVNLAVTPCTPVQVVELTDAGKDFLRGAFRRADRDRDGALSAAEQDDMWSTAPAS
jgi:hypothetical protein